MIINTCLPSDGVGLDVSFVACTKSAVSGDECLLVFERCFTGRAGRCAFGALASGSSLIFVY